MKTLLYLLNVAVTYLHMPTGLLLIVEDLQLCLLSGWCFESNRSRHIYDPGSAFFQQLILEPERDMI